MEKHIQVVQADLLVVLVLYEIPLRESTTLNSLSRALKHGSGSLFVYDNSAFAQNFESDIWDVTYCHDPSNPGVSKAFNEGFKKAVELNKKWLMLVDQDTDFPENIFEKYFSEMVNSNCEVLVPILRDKKGIVSPSRFYLGGGQRIDFLNKERELPIRKYLFHNSGLLVSTNAFKKAGGYDENLQLDFSDFSFAKRLEKKYAHFKVIDITCEHNLASTSYQNLDRRLYRFKHYKKSASYFNKTYRVSGLLMLRVFFRGIKLSWQYRTLKFIFSYFEG